MIAVLVPLASFIGLLWATSGDPTGLWKFLTLAGASLFLLVAGLVRPWKTQLSIILVLNGYLALILALW